jgi:hypothetical protein
MVSGIRTGRLLLPLAEQGDQWRAETRLEVLDVCALLMKFVLIIAGLKGKVTK